MPRRFTDAERPPEEQARMRAMNEALQGLPPPDAIHLAVDFLALQIAASFLRRPDMAVEVARQLGPDLVERVEAMADAIQLLHSEGGHA